MTGLAARLFAAGDGADDPAAEVPEVAVDARQEQQQGGNRDG